MEQIRSLEPEQALSPQLLLQAQQDGQLLNGIYKELSEKLGVSAAVEIYRMFRGQQISFPVRLLDPKQVQIEILRAYDGTNLRDLANRYGYSEKSVRRMLQK